MQILNLVASGQQRAQLGMLTIQKQQHIGVLITGANAEIPPFTLFSTYQVQSYPVSLYTWSEDTRD